jgi:hypothetical protein
VDAARHAGPPGVVGQQVVGVFDAEAGYDQPGVPPVGRRARRLVDGIAVDGAHGEAGELLGVGVDRHDRLAVLTQPIDDTATECIHANNDDVAAQTVRRWFGRLLPCPEPRQRAVRLHGGVEAIAVEEQERRQGKREQAHQRDHRQERLVDQARRHGECAEDERELTDLGQAEAGPERGFFPVPELRQHGDEEERLHDHHEGRERQGEGPPRKGRPQLHLQAERHEKDDDEEVHQRVHALAQLVALRQLREGDARQKGPQLGREVQRLGPQHHEEAPEEAPDEQSLGHP